MRRKAAVHCSSEMTRRHADIFITRLACGALSTTDPRVDRDLRAGFGIRIGSRVLNDAGNFVAERKGQSPARAYVEQFAVA